jgi:hypothetical protein
MLLLIMCMHYTRMEKLAKDKHPNLLGPLVS